jgi:hypothetical protein
MRLFEGYPHATGSFLLQFVWGWTNALAALEIEPRLSVLAPIAASKRNSTASMEHLKDGELF